MFSILENIGKYTLLMQKVFSRPEKMRIYRERIIYEMEALGLNSIGLTAIISVFIGAAVTLQMAITLESPFIPQYLIGYATREVMILEFSSTVVALILAGKVGSNIASEIGTMRITEQIDALEIMGPILLKKATKSTSKITKNPHKTAQKKRGTRLLSFHGLRSSHYPDVGTDNAKPTSNISYNDDYIICAKSVPNQRRHNHGYLHPIGHLSLLGS